MIDKTLGLYVHIPFCVKKCNYCDFVSGCFDDEIKKEYVFKLIDEIKIRSEKYTDYYVDSVFFGGGTPSLLKIEWLKAVLDSIKSNYKITDNCEITIECNPGTLTYEKLYAYKDMGINRLSIGLQSADDKELAILGRIHTYSDFVENFQLSREVGFDNINVDLIGAIPNQSVESFTSNLEKVKNLDVDHISVYSLIVEEGTPFYDMDLNLPNEDDERKMVHIIPEILGIDFHQYEISNYCKNGRECRHNIKYWKRNEYLGFGASAASLIYSDYDNVGLFGPDLRIKNTENVIEYIKSDSFVYSEKEKLSKNDVISEYMFLGLRMNEGIDVELFQNLFGVDFYSIYGKTVEKYKRNGLLFADGNRLKLTTKGRDLSNVVFADFLL